MKKGFEAANKLKPAVGFKDARIIGSEKCLVAILWEGENLGRTKLDEIERNDKGPILFKTEQQCKEYLHLPEVRIPRPKDETYVLHLSPELRISNICKSQLSLNRLKINIIADGAFFISP